MDVKLWGIGFIKQKLEIRFSPSVTSNPNMANVWVMSYNIIADTVCETNTIHKKTFRRSRIRNKNTQRCIRT